jgi:hypothetical protein
MVFALFALVTCAALLVPACSGDSGAARTDADASVASDGDAAAPSTPASLRVVVGAAALRTGEDGARATFTVALGSRPTQTVIVPLASSNESETKIDASALTFTPDAAVLTRTA